VIDDEVIRGKIRIQGEVYSVKIILSGYLKNKKIKITEIKTLQIKPYNRIVKNVLIKILKTDPWKIVQFKENKLLLV